jgi:hypothetical protein
MTDESFEINGHWWLPGKTGHRVAGRLFFDPETGAELALIGTLRGFDENKTTAEDGSTVTEITESSLSGVYPLIHGDDGSNAFTLIDCFRTRSKTRFPSMNGEEVIRVNSFLKGALFEGGPLDAEGVTVSTKYFAHWIDVHGFEEDLDGSVPGLLSKTLRISQRPAESSTLANGMKATVAHGIGWDGDGIVSRTLSQDYKFTVRNSSLIELQDLLDITSDFQDLVSIGTGRTAEYRQVWFSRSDVQQQSLAGTDQGEMALSYFARWNARDADGSKNLWSHDMYFSYGDLGGMSAVQRWLDVAAKYRSLLSAVMATRYSMSMFVSDRLLNRAAALESLDTKISGFINSSFKTRIARCGQLAGPEFIALIGSDVEEWAKAIKFERDDIAHHLGRHIRRDSPDQYYLSESLYWAFALCMLREMNAPQAVFSRIIKHQHMGFLGPKVESAVATVAALADAEAAGGS